MNISENEERRAVNLVWNAAGDYSFEPDFKVFDPEGRAELYWNTVVGAARREYDWPRLAAFFRTLRGSADPALCETLLWLGLEGAVFRGESARRPALARLRESYARTVAERTGAGDGGRAQRLLAAWFCRTPERRPDLPPEDAALLDGLRFGAEADTDAVIARASVLFRQYLGYRPEAAAEAEKQKKPLWGAFLRLFGRENDTANLAPVRGFALGLGEHSGERGEESEEAHRRAVRLPRPTALKEFNYPDYIAGYFGKCIYDKKQMQALEREFCTGTHRDCHLHITRGETDPALRADSYEARRKRAAEKQEGKNRAWYEAGRDRNRLAVARLTNRLRNSLLTQLESSAVRSNAGRLEAGRVWRGVLLDDGKVFSRELRGDAGNLTVDILLDGSLSQSRRQELISTQGYIVAQSLTNCGIPVRILSFCSMNGYTVLNILRDYGETKANGNVFRFFTAGCNRDGLAIRTAAGLLRRNDAEHRMLILLSDAKPNDVLKVETAQSDYREYRETVGIEDTAAEVHLARVRGICVACVFTGTDEDLPAAVRIYGRDLARIRSLDHFADTVAALLSNQIASL